MALPKFWEFPVSFCFIIALGLPIFYAFMYMWKGSVARHGWGVPDPRHLWTEQWPRWQETWILALLCPSSVTLARSLTLPECQFSPLSMDL